MLTRAAVLSYSFSFLQVPPCLFVILGAGNIASNHAAKWHAHMAFPLMKELYR